jgi:hypothetical protein
MRSVWVWMIVAALGGCKSKPKATPEDCEKIFWHAMDLGLRKDPSFDEAARAEIRAAFEEYLAGTKSGDVEVDEMFAEAVKLRVDLMEGCRDLEKENVDCVLSKQDPDDFTACAFVF